MSIKTAITQRLGRTNLTLKKYSPEILTATGIIAGGATVYLAAKATLEVGDVLDDIKERKNDVLEYKTLLDNGDMGEKTEDAIQQEHIRNLTAVYTYGALKLTRLYGPAFSTGVASIACIIGAHGIMKKRNAALVVAYNGLEKAFNHYREKVAEKFGVDEEKEVYVQHAADMARQAQYGQTDEEKEQAKKNPVTGKSMYARFFDPFSTQWHKDPTYNLTFLLGMQRFANDKLISQGHLFLNEVYDLLGLERTRAGSVVGWTIDGDGDRFVDFNLFDIHSEDGRAFVNGLEPAILLDFNVDGVINDKLGA